MKTALAAPFRRALAVTLSFFACLAMPCSASADSNVKSFVEVSHERSLDSAYAPRSWYGDSIVLVSTAVVGLHYYDGGSIGIEVTCSSESDGTLSVGLWRKTAGGRSDLLGGATFDRNGFTRVTWKGFDPGTYYFVLEKPSDGTVVKCSDMAMYS